jgi:cyclophilin family peptidyl-prolyl cis-trans isomerase
MLVYSSKLNIFAFRFPDVINQTIQFMNIVKKISFFAFIIILVCCKSPASNENTIVLLKTTMGDIKLKLYDSTPVHRDNFIKILNSGLYDNVIFHRVIRDFMIQSGDPSTRLNNSSSQPDTLKNYTIPAEFIPAYYHKKGALAAARRGNEENPDLRSSGTQFYIVQGIKYTDAELDQAELKINSNIKQALFNKLIKQTADSLRSTGKVPSDSEIQEAASVKMFDILTNLKPYKISGEQRNTYKTTGGVPRLDATYTVFGEVISGLEVVDKIASVPTDSNDKPISDVRILKIKIVKN